MLSKLGDKILYLGDKIHRQDIQKSTSAKWRTPIEIINKNSSS
jgi:hypothetical protein